MNEFHTIVNELKSKYSNPEDLEKFMAEFNDKIAKYHNSSKNVESFFNWLDHLRVKLDLNIKSMTSSFFPSLTFAIVYQIQELDEYKIFKQEIISISFIEDYHTSFFSAYIYENKESELVTYRPTKTPKRDSCFDQDYLNVLKEVEIQFPKSKYMDYKYTKRIIGKLPLTYSTQEKTPLYEILFRSIT